MQESVNLQLQHWDLIGAADFSLPYHSSVARFCEFNQRAGAASSQLLPSAKQLSDSTASLQVEIDGFLKSIAAAA